MFKRLLRFNEFLAYIPARKNSIRVKNKNILRLGGKPLISYTLKAAKKSKYVNYIYISTDSKEVKKLVKKEKIKFYNFRKKKLSESKITMHELLSGELNILKNKFPKFKYIVLLQPTSPFRTEHDIDKSCKLFLKNIRKANCLVSTTILNKSCDESKIMYSNGKYLQFKKNRNFKKKRLRNGPALMILKRDKFKKNLLSGKILDFKMSKKKSIDINIKKDFDDAKKILKFFK